MPREWNATDDSAWQQALSLTSESYRCGYCGNDVASNSGWHTSPARAYVRICPQCNVPTFFSVHNEQIPGPLLGGNVAGLEDEIADIYKEARASITVNAYTGAVMLCRKILMNVSVANGAEEGLRFAQYVEWLIAERYAPKGSEKWVNYIRNRGNEANHVIRSMTREDAEGVLRFTEQLLRNMYELPDLIPPFDNSDSSSES